MTPGSGIPQTRSPTRTAGRCEPEREGVRPRSFNLLNFRPGKMALIEGFLPSLKPRSKIADKRPHPRIWIRVTTPSPNPAHRAAQGRTTGTDRLSLKASALRVPFPAAQEFPCHPNAPGILPTELPWIAIPSSWHDRRLRRYPASRSISSPGKDT